MSRARKRLFLTTSKSGDISRFVLVLLAAKKIGHDKYEPGDDLKSYMTYIKSVRGSGSKNKDKAARSRSSSISSRQIIKKPKTSNYSEGSRPLYFDKENGGTYCFNNGEKMYLDKK